MVAKDGEIVHAQAAGFADREAGRPVQLDSIFRYASLTKPLTAATALAMMDRGLLGLDDAVADHLPWFRPRLRDGREPTITIRHLLTHTSGLDYSDLWVNTGLTNSDRTLEENYGLVAKQPLNFEPGTAWLYGCSTDVLGAVVAQRHGGTLGDALAHYVTGPLGMTDTGHAVTNEDRLVVPYADGPPGLRRMSDPDTISYEDGHQLIFSPGRIFNPKAFHSGGGGAVGTAKDFLTFLETVRMGGQPILRRETLAEAVQNQIGDLPRDRPGQRFGFLGAVVDDPAAADRPVAKGTVRWGGVYGNDWLVDFENRLSVVVLTNTPIAGCDGPFSQAVVRAVYG
jgi:CubicO group peptidase (beta-lactamase class C family)